MALDNAAIIGSGIGMFIAMVRKYKIKWWFFIYVIFQSIGTFFGAYLLIIINETILRIIFITAIILLVIKNLFIKDKKHTEKGFKETPKNIFLLSLSGIFIGFYGGAFVIGDWIIALLILTSGFAFKYHEAIFLLTFTMLFAQPVGAYQYITHSLIDFNFLIPMIIATTIGGIISAIILDKIHSDKLEHFLKYLSVFLVIYLIFGFI